MATITKTLTVANKSGYILVINAIPTGSTVTPVNDIQIWLHCADIWDKAYTTIDQVLADASTLQALIASNNAVDYMARSTSWASSVTANSNAMTYIGNNNYCASKLLANSTWSNAICNSLYFESVLNVKVPTMTSDTTPSGVASANAINWGAGGREAYKAFDGNNDSLWWGAWSNNTSWVQYAFPNNIKLSKATCYISIGSWDYVGEQASAVIEYSTDGTNWTQFGNTITHVIPSESEKRMWHIVTATEKTCKYVRFRNLDNKAGAGKMAVFSLQFYGRA